MGNLQFKDDKKESLHHGSTRRGCESHFEETGSSGELCYRVDNCLEKDIEHRGHLDHREGCSRHPGSIHKWSLARV